MILAILEAPTVSQYPGPQYYVKSWPPTCTQNAVVLHTVGVQVNDFLHRQLGGPALVTTTAIAALTMIIVIVTLPKTPLTTTHGPPSMNFT